MKEASIQATVPWPVTDPMEIIFRPEWQSRAACAGMDQSIFFPPGGGSVKRAKKVCANCPVKAQCLDMALLIPYHIDEAGGGVFGGTTRYERRSLRRERKAQRKADAA